MLRGLVETTSHMLALGCWTRVGTDSAESQWPKEELHVPVPVTHIYSKTCGRAEC